MRTAWAVRVQKEKHHAYFFLFLSMLFALGVPALVHAQVPTQLQLNDAAVLEDFCTLFEAERAYFDDAIGGYPHYTSDINDLINGNYLPPSWSTANSGRNGYSFVLWDAGGIGYYNIAASPLVIGITGSWNLYGDWGQTIHIGSGGTAPLFTYSPCDIAKDIGTNEAKVIEDLYTVYVALQTDSLGRGYEVYFSDYQSPYLDGILYGQWWDGDRRRNGYVYSYRGEGLDAGLICPNCRYSMVAVPENFGVTGNRAFFMDQSGVIRAENYRNAGPASQPITDTATFPLSLWGDSYRNEVLQVNSNACQIHQAQVNYQAANAVYTGDWYDLMYADPPYLDPALDWGGSSVDGYLFSLNDPSGLGDAYEVTLIPTSPGLSGVRAYFFDYSGVLRVGDPYSGGADWNSPIIGNVCDEIIKLNPVPPAETPPALYHSGDYAVQDYKITLSELIRFIQFYNVGSLSCAPGSEDGFAAGAGDTSCSPHSGDYNAQDWIISLGELLRLIQLFNIYGYFPCPNPGEDGYCPIL